jgi:hypothetical protein
MKFINLDNIQSYIDSQDLNFSIINTIGNISHAYGTAIDNTTGKIHPYFLHLNKYDKLTLKIGHSELLEYNF